MPIERITNEIAPGVSQREIIEMIHQVRLLIPEVRKVTEKINGNGKVGLEQRVETIERWIAGVEDLRSRLVLPISVASLLAALFFVAAVLTHRIDVVFR